MYKKLSLFAPCGFTLPFYKQISYREYSKKKGSDIIQIWINEDVYKDPAISVYGLATYCSIKSLLFTEEQKEICVTLDLLSYQLMKKLHYQRRFMGNIATGYEELIKQHIITQVDEKGKYFVIDCSKLYLNTENNHFTIITYEEIVKIFNIPSVNNFVLLKYFIFLMGTISSSIYVWLDAFENKNRVVGTMTISTLSKLSGISERSIKDYNKILEDNGLIYVYRPNDLLINENSGKIKRMVNIYGRPEDKVYIDKFGSDRKKYEKSYKYVKNNIESANTKRRLAQMYIQIKRGNDQKYSQKDVQDVFRYVVEENTKYEKLYNTKNDERYLDKVRDTDVFLKYDFLENQNDEI